MGYKTPAKYRDKKGKTIVTKPIRVPEYLADRLEAIAKQWHEENLKQAKDAKI